MRKNSNTHRRGISQQITNKIYTKQKQCGDIRNNYAHSSQHTRSTGLNTFRSKDNQKIKQKQKEKESARVTSAQKNKNKKIKDFDWKQDQAPFSSHYIVKKYANYLQPYQIAEIKQYQNIYFIGNKKIQTDNENENDKNQLYLQEDGFLNCKKGDHIAYRYEIIQKINHGSFGEVYKVYDHKIRELQALKIVKKMPDLVKQTFIQISILTTIKQKDKGNISGIVRLKDFALFRQHICITFELLDANLYELLHANQFKGLSESCVRIFAVQMLNSLNFLYRMQIVHCDIKPQNFVLKSWGKSGIKLIDFGTSCYESHQIYTYIQSRYYRAPQVLFQRQYSTSIDMWSFACLIAELSLGKPLFPGNSDIHQLVYMINLLGFPQLEYANRQNKYLQKDQNNRFIKQNLDRFEKNTGYKLQQESLKPLNQRFSQDMFPFVHFLKQILKWDPKDRITPLEALKHPWITFGLPNQIQGIYTAYENLQKNNDKLNQITKKVKRVKSKAKSKSRERSEQQKDSSIQKRNLFTKNSLRITLGSTNNQSKNLRYDLPSSILTAKSKITAKRSQEKSKQEKSNKSPHSTKKFQLK